MPDTLPVADLAAREDALAPTRSFIVQAPAGSGKTELLIQRYLGLLATVDEPEEIVAITFTRKAAAEMRARVLDAFAQLKSASGPGSAHARRTRELARAALARDVARGWRIDDSPARLRIQTIDSLCAALTRQMPMLSRFGSQPESIEDAGALYAEAARATVDLIEGDDPAADYVERLLAHLDNDVERVEELLVDMLRRRDHWLRHVMAQKRGDLEAMLAAERHAVLARARALIAPASQRELLHIANLALSNLGRPAMASLPGSDDADGWTALADLLLTETDTWRKSLNRNNGFSPGPAHAPAKQRALALIAELSASEPLRTALADARRLPSAGYGDEQWRVLEAITELLKCAVGQLKLAFQSRGQVDFTEVSQRALLALEDSEGPTDLALRLDYQIRHLLIDEFQDTSISQFELVAKLTAGWTPDDGRTLFAVGDPMQSIYRFREAEVGLFLKARAEGIGNVVLEPLELSANFRSQAGIVDWVNQTFVQVMPQFEDIASGAVAYAGSRAVHAQLEGAAVEVHARIAGGEASEAAQVADIAAAIAAANAKHGKAESTAILVRGRSHLREIVPRLKQAGLAFRAIEIDRLDDRPVVQDLLALTRALAHGGDRLAWLAILRAPWCGLTLADLLAIGGAQTGSSADAPDAPPTIWNAINSKRVVPRLSADARLRLERIRPVLAAALAVRQRSSLRDMVEGSWLALGGPACAASATELEDAATYLDHLESKEEAGAIADFGAFTQGLDKLYALPDMAAGEGAVQIMTIHKAKGLEFDHVIVPGLERKPPAEGKKLFLWMERPANPDASSPRSARSDTSLLLAPIEETGAERDSIYTWIKKLAAEKSAFEDGRLLYVAATRARQRLHLLGETGLLLDKNGAQTARKPDARSLLAKLWPVVSDEYQRVAATAPAASGPQAAGGDSVPDQSLRRLASAWILPAPPAALAWSAARETARTQDDIEYSWVGETARQVGSVVHRWLQNIAEDELRGWNPERIEGMHAAFNNELLARGVEASQLAQATGRVARALASALADPRGRWLLGPQQGARSEYRLTAMVDGARRNLVIDRCFIDSEGRRWIVDYKTSGHEGADLDGFLDQEQERYRSQLEYYAQALAQGEVAMLGLYFPLLAGWREWGP
ncbi:MAG: UvrD-helicase domain-containing protein [Burkholderiales bacterium]|nr:UvrD-helicase domain-containing protein [Burkholderiales bacterium]